MEEKFVAYLKSNPNFSRFMTGLKHNYKRLGHLGGTIALSNVTKEEAQALEGLLGISFLDGKGIRITYQKLMKRLKGTKFEDVDFVKVLELYFGTSLITNKEKRTKKEDSANIAVQELTSRYQDSHALKWLTHIQNANVNLYTKIIKQFQEDKSLVINSLNAINQLPFWTNQIISLSVFANNIAKDPHFFDKGFGSTILTDAISYFLGYEKRTTSSLEKNRALLEAGLTKEDGLNYCITSRLFAQVKDGSQHLGIAYFSNLYEPFNLHVGNILNISCITEIKHVVIVENPSVFQVLNETAKENNLKNVAFICSNGELNLAVYLLLDKINESADVLMHYAGDFDPEGLLIADKLKRRYGDNLIFLGYEVKNYELARSAKVIEDYRLKKLDKCTCVELGAVKEALVRTKQPGYQEALIPMYQKKLLEFFT